MVIYNFRYYPKIKLSNCASIPKQDILTPLVQKTSFQGDFLEENILEDAPRDQTKTVRDALKRLKWSPELVQEVSRKSNHGIQNIGCHMSKTVIYSIGFYRPWRTEVLPMAEDQC